MFVIEGLFNVTQPYVGPLMPMKEVVDRQAAIPLTGQNLLCYRFVSECACGQGVLRRIAYDDNAGERVHVILSAGVIGAACQ